MSRIWSKICGVSTLAEAHAAQVAGADAIGLNFYQPSARFVETSTAREVAAGVSGVSRIGLFVDADATTVSRVLSEVELDILQFHGSESAAFCEQFSIPWIKVIRIGEGTRRADISYSIEQHAGAWGILCDTHIRGSAGGTGRTFDWSLFPREEHERVILAGGLTPENVLEAVERTCPFGVDVCGGIESSPGIQCSQKVKEFIGKLNSIVP